MTDVGKRGERSILLPLRLGGRQGTFAPLLPTLFREELAFCEVRHARPIRCGPA